MSLPELFQSGGGGGGGEGVTTVSKLQNVTEIVGNMSMINYLLLIVNKDLHCCVTI